MKTILESAQQLIVFLSGKKTYLVSIAAIVYAIGIGRHWWPSDVQVWGILGGTGAMTLRAAVAKLLVQVVTPEQYLKDLSRQPDLLRAAAVAAGQTPPNKEIEKLPQNAP